jgi:hypothetical protein
MRFIPTRVHGMADYLTAAATIILPFFFISPETTVACWVLIGTGVVLLASSLLTRYELGLFRAIPMAGHLALDFALGIFLIASPWLFGFADIVWWPHVLVGLADVGAALFTRLHSPAERGPVVAMQPATGHR